MESHLSMDKARLVSLCSLADRKARAYYDIIELSLPDEERRELAVRELEGVMRCVLGAAKVVNNIIKDMEV